jgi:hypothetical protein
MGENVSGTFLFQKICKPSVGMGVLLILTLRSA